MFRFAVLAFLFWYADRQDGALRILDFGLARGESVDGNMTGYVTCRWYRAPEIVALGP